MKIKKIIVILIAILAVSSLFLYLASHRSNKDIEQESIEKNITEEKNITTPVHKNLAEQLTENPLKGVVMTPERISSSSLKQLKNYGAELIYLEIKDFWSQEEPYIPNKKIAELLENALKKTDEQKIKVIIVPLTGPGKGEDNYEVFTRTRAKEGWEMMLQDLISQTKDHKSIIGWSIMGEPNAEIYFLEEDSDDFEKSGKIWNELINRYAKIIRQESNKLIVISPLGSGKISGLSNLETINDENVAYAVKFFYPEKYTLRQEPPFEYSYEQNAEKKSYSKEDLEKEISPLIDFKNKNNVPIIIGGFGGVRYVPNLDTYLKDILEIFDKNKLSHAYYGWNSENPAFRIEFGENPYNRELKENSPLFKTLLDSWSKD